MYIYSLQSKVPKLNVCNIYLKDFLQRVILDILTIMEVNVKTKPPKIIKMITCTVDGEIMDNFFSFSYPHKFYKNSNNQH